jgi:hypothetical protein
VLEKPSEMGSSVRGGSFQIILMPKLNVLRRRHSAAVQSLEPMTLKESERHHIDKTLEEAWITAGPRGTAVHLGMKSSKVYLRMRKLEISRTLNCQRRDFARAQLRKRCSIVEELSARHAFADALWNP